MLCNNKQHDDMAFQACETLPDMECARGKWKVTLWPCRAVRRPHPPPPPPPEIVQMVQLTPEKKGSASQVFPDSSHFSRPNDALTFITGVSRYIVGVTRPLSFLNL